jgi:hypothetical protein
VQLACKYFPLPGSVIVAKDVMSFCEELCLVKGNEDTTLLTLKKVPTPTYDTEIRLWQSRSKKSKRSYQISCTAKTLKSKSAKTPILSLWLTQHELATCVSALYKCESQYIYEWHQCYKSSRRITTVTSFSSYLGESEENFRKERMRVKYCTSDKWLLQVDFYFVVSYWPRVS